MSKVAVKCVYEKIAFKVIKIVKIPKKTVTLRLNKYVISFPCELMSVVST